MKGLCNISAIINQVSLVMCKELGLRVPKPTFFRLLMVDHIVKILIGIIYNI